MTRPWSALPLVVMVPLGLSCRKGDGAARRGGALPVITTKTGVRMVRVPGCWFEMGSTGGPADEAPVHRVWVDSFLIDTCEVTQEQFRRLRMPDPSHFKHLRRPVEQVTFGDAIEYCNERSDAEGLQRCYVLDEAAGTWRCNFQADGYRLPTEAEWECACRAGTSGRRFFDGAGEAALKRYAWYAANSSGRTHPVGSKQPNPWGLYDVYGNVAEWCHDRYAADYYRASPPRNPRGPPGGKLVVRRGGAWDSKARRCRSAARAAENPRFHDICFARDTIGFRCVRRAPPQTPRSQPAATR